MKRDTLWSVALVAVFLAAPIWLVSTEPVEAVTASWWQFILATAGVLVFIAGGVLFVVQLATSYLPRGRVRSVAEIERTQILSSLVFVSLVITLALEMATTYPEVAGPYAALALAYALWCAPVSSRQLSLQLTVDVRCSPEAAFALVSNPRNWHSYFPEIEVAESSEEPVRLGTVIDAVHRVGSLVVRDVEEVIAFEPARRFGTASVHRRPTDALYELTWLADGTRIAFTHSSVMTYSQALLGGLLRRGAILKRATDRRRTSLSHIKRILESPVRVLV